MAWGELDGILAEVVTAKAIQKIATNPGLIPEEIQPYKQASMVYDNTDHLEETTSGAGTTYRVNGIVTQKDFIVPKLSQNLIDIRKSKRNSIYLEPSQLPVYNVGIRPEHPVLPNMNTAQKMKKSLMENFLFCVQRNVNLP